EVAPNVSVSRVPFLSRFASEMRLNLRVHDFLPVGVTVPPSLKTVFPAVSTATMCGQSVALLAVTETTGAPNCSTARSSGQNVYPALPFAVNERGPLRTIVKRFTFGTVA